MYDGLGQNLAGLTLTLDGVSMCPQLVQPTALRAACWYMLRLTRCQGGQPMSQADSPSTAAGGIARNSDGTHPHMFLICSWSPSGWCL